VDATDPRRAQPPISLTQIRTMAKSSGGAHGSRDENRHASLAVENKNQDMQRANQLKGIKKEISSMFRPSDYARRITDFEDGLIAMELQPQPNDPEHELRDMNGDDAESPVLEPAIGVGSWSTAGSLPWGLGGSAPVSYGTGVGPAGAALSVQLPGTPPAGWGGAPGIGGLPVSPQSLGVGSGVLSRRGPQYAPQQRLLPMQLVPASQEQPWASAPPRARAGQHTLESQPSVAVQG